MTYYYEYEKKTLKPYAQFSPKKPICISRNWKQEYHESRHRTPYQKDRDKIVYSLSFRALEQKTQVFIRDLDTQTRSRMTHSIEVYSIATEMGRKLGLNVDLIQAISFGHDIGHSPFGHAGERFFAEKFASFSHNNHGVKVVGDLDYFGPDWNTQRTRYGLNVTIEVAEGILKHSSYKVDEYIKSLNDYLYDTYKRKIEIDTHGTLEAQVVAVSDEVAQKTADIADARRLKLVEESDISALSASVFDNPKKSYADYMIDNVYDTVKEALGSEPYDLENIKNRHIVKIEDVEKDRQFETFLRKYVYDSELVRHFDKMGKEILDTLYNYYLDNLHEMGVHYSNDRQGLGDSDECKVMNFLCSLTERQIVKLIFSKNRIKDRCDENLLEQILGLVFNKEWV